MKEDNFTFNLTVLSAANDANDNDSDDDDGDGRDDGHDEVGVGEEVHPDLPVELPLGAEDPVLPDLTR